MTANKTQIGGNHYKVDTDGEEHWDRVARMGLSYFQASATKYIERAYLKGNPIQDLEKAQHFIQKLIELEKNKNVVKAVKSENSMYRGDLRFKDPHDL